jgi:uncharacterized membrane protein YkvA (DUF1232 family)
MAVRVTSWLSRPVLLRTLFSHVRLAFRLIREPRVALLTKALPFVAALYVVSPLDFVPDVVPLLGQLDDLGIVLIALEGFLRLCPAEIVAFHRAAIAQSRRYTPMSPTDSFIDVEWRREE